ncbi:MAG: hypothetical protein WC584_04615 [Candidatus Pacearchaeota archaeon]
MKKLVTKKTKKINRWLYWTPRILSILFILFLAMFSLDVFDSASSLGDILIGLFMHNIPVFILLIVLLISWKHEIIGGIAFIFAGLLYIFTLLMNPQLEWYMLSWSLIIAGPAFLIGILWLLNWRKKKD